ncbi:MAG TPA: hypothetical protein VGB91_12115 [Rhizomicrobium sp.]
MTVTVLNEDAESTTIVTDPARRFSWSAAFAGAFAATGVSFMLLTLGSGIGLSLVTVRHATESGTVTFLTLGAVYFLAAQAFGFAVGGHVVGRLIGPAVETSREEDFRAGAHGLVSWAIAVLATAAVVALSVLAAGATASNSPIDAALAASTRARTSSDVPAPTATSYWVDKLFRSTADLQAAAAWGEYAQADTGTATDMPPSNGPALLAPGDQQTSMPSSNSETPAGARMFQSGGMVEHGPAAQVITSPQPATRSLGADKAEAGRILTVGMADGERLSSEDRIQLAHLVALDTGLTASQAEHHVDSITGRIRAGEIATAEAARQAAAYVSLWTAFALLFGGVVAVAAAISARWEDDREAGLMPGTRVVETRF